MRLQRLTGLEQDKIVDEYREVMEHIADLLDILAKPERVTRRSSPTSCPQLKSEFGEHSAAPRSSAAREDLRSRT